MITREYLTPAADATRRVHSSRPPRSPERGLATLHSALRCLLDEPDTDMDNASAPVPMGFEDPQSRYECPRADDQR